MDGETLREHLKRRPFAPSGLRLPGGREITAMDPKLTMFNESGRTLVVAQAERAIMINVATAQLFGSTVQDD